MDIKSRTKGCFIGKNIGGTLGAIYESVENPIDLKYYEPVPRQAMPNDDLDLQLVWLEHFEEKGIELDNKYLGQAWLDHIDFHPDEYGVAIGNIRKGIKPPLSGMYNNFFHNGMGAAIRSEIWASLFPGEPLVAAHFAYHDASVDHWGDGIYAEMLLAAAESLIFVGEDIIKALKFGLQLLPVNSVLKEAVESVFHWHERGIDYCSAREMVMKLYGSNNATDCIMNVCFIMLGILYGEEDFEKSLLLAVNCGYDTDCTGATVGAIFGIVCGEDGIPEKWKKPIGREIIASDYIKDISAPKDIDELTKRIENVRLSSENKTLPQVDIPFNMPRLEAVNEKNIWRVNGKLLRVPGMFLPGSEFPVEDYQPVVIENDVVFKDSMDVQLMVCATTMFRTLWDSRDLGFKGDLSEMVPCFNRVKGGRIFPLSVKKGKVYRLRIEMRYTLPVPDVAIGFADINNRYLNNFKYRMGDDNNK